MVPLRADALPSLRDHLPVPEYDRAAARVGVVHIGVGGFHRAHQAVYHDRLLAAGALDWGICGVGLLPGDRRMQAALDAQDGLYTLIVKHPDGRYEPRVIGSVLEYLFGPDDPAAVVDRLAAPETRAVTLTITEGGYGGPGPAFDLLVAALARRRDAGLPAPAVLSCDNLVDNGDLARAAVVATAQARDGALADWIDAEVPFPNAVVDRITPATTEADRDELRARTGVEDRWPVVCEPHLTWVLQDALPAGPPYGDAGARLVADVDPYERMKLRLLNAGHQAVAYVGRLSRHRLVHEAAADPAIHAFLVGYLVEEATPTLAPLPPGELEAFRDAVPVRFGNPAVGDTLERLAMDASDRIPKFVLPVIADQLARGGPLRRAAAIVAAWARCLEGQDEQGDPIVVADGRAEVLCALAREEDPLAFIGDREVFGDLAGQPRFVEAYLDARRSLRERGVRATLAALG